MFICAKCKAKMDLPLCSQCGWEYEKKNGVWQLSDMPDIVVEGDEDKYIGYEYIGENYSGNRKYIIEDKDLAVAKEIAGLTRGGRFPGPGLWRRLFYGSGCIFGDKSNSRRYFKHYA